MCCRLFPVCAAEQVLGHFRAQFIDTVDTNAIVHEVVRQSIISNGDWNTITKTSDRTQQDQYLHGRLLQTCDQDALGKVCKIIIDVQGNPRMNSLGNEMKDMLGGKCCVHVYMCIHVSVILQWPVVVACVVLLYCGHWTGQLVLCSMYV